jgi:hypothetical protein
MVGDHQVTRINLDMLEYLQAYMSGDSVSAYFHASFISA